LAGDHVLQRVARPQDGLLRGREYFFCVEGHDPSLCMSPLSSLLPPPSSFLLPPQMRKEASLANCNYFRYS
jgi:hypothetical protein